MRKIIFSLVLILCGVGVFLQVKDCGFVWNDQQAITSPNGTTASLAATLADTWQPTRGEAYEPMARTVWALTRAVTGPHANEARVFHLVSLGFHLGTATLVFLILALVLESVAAPLIGALVFAVHPLQVEAVAHVAALRVVLGAFFALLAVWQYLLYARRAGEARNRGREVRHGYVATVLFVLALLSSAATIITPLIALVLARLMPKRHSLIATKAPIWPLVLWTVLAIPQAAWSLFAQNTQMVASQVHFWARPLVAGDAITFYLAKVFAPVMIGPDYGRSPAFVLSHWWGYATWIIPVLLILALTSWRTVASRWYTAATMLLIVGLLPYLGLVLFEAQKVSTVADQFIYLAMLGPALAAAYTVSMPRASWLPAAVIASVIGFGYLSNRETANWKNDASLWSHAVSINKASPTAQAALGDGYRRQGDWRNARLHYEKVLETNTLDAATYYYLAEIERLHGDETKAVDLYKKTVALDPGNAAAWGQLGLAYLHRGDLGQALEHLKKAAQLAPEDEVALRNLGMLYVRRKAYGDAIPCLTKALRLAEQGTPPKELLASMHALLGLSLAYTHQSETAQGHLETALALDPENAEAQRSLADIYFAQKRYDLARPHYEKAVAKGVNDLEVLNNLGLVLAMNHEYSQAARYFARSLELKASQPEILNALGTSQFRLRQFKDATASFSKALALKPSMADPHFFLGDIARWQGREPQALAEYYRALKIDPTHVDANYRVGNYFLKKNRPAEAARHFEAALKASPDDAKLLYSLRKAKKAQGDDATTM